MGKDKGTKAAAPVKDKKVSKVDSVKSGRVTKASEKPKAVSKETAKKTAKEVEKKSKKSKKEPTPSDSSDSESESEDESSDSSDSSESEEEKLAPKANGKKDNKKEAKKEESSDSSDSDSSSESEEEKPATKSKKDTKKPGKKEESSSDSDSSDSDSEAKAGAKDTEMKDADSSDDSSSDSDSDEEAEKKDAKKDSSDDSSDDSDSSDDEEEEKKEDAPSKKRKAEEATAPASKKIKVFVNGEEKEATANLFVGNLSWNIDEEWLTREFEEFGELAGVRIITDRDSGRSKGFGYVEFTTVENGAKALEGRNGYELDGRNLRVDFSAPRDSNAQTPQQRQNDRASKFGDVKNPPAQTLFVGNISFDADESTLTETFQEYGSINSIRMPTDRETGAPKGFGYVEMASVEEAQAAFDALQGADVAGRPIRLDFAQARDPSASGGRGGFGGDRGGRGGRGGGRGGRGGFGDRGGRGGARGGRGGAPRGGFNRGGFGDFSGKKVSFD